MDITFWFCDDSYVACLHTKGLWNATFNSIDLPCLLMFWCCFVKVFFYLVFLEMRSYSCMWHYRQNRLDKRRPISDISNVCCLRKDFALPKWTTKHQRLMHWRIWLHKFSVGDWEINIFLYNFFYTNLEFKMYKVVSVQK